MIKVTYRAVDGARLSRSFKAVSGASRFAISYVGAHPEFGPGYAISGDGIGRVSVQGCSLAELFSGSAETVEVREPYRSPAERAAEEARLARIVPGDLEDIFADFIAQERGLPADM